MSTTAPNLTMSPADLLQYRRDLVRTQKFLSLGRIRTIAIGPTAGYTPPPNDPYISGFGAQPQRNARGRMIDLSGQWLPIGQDTNTGMILITAPLRRADGYVGLPDLVDPLWRAADYTEEEAANPDCSENCLIPFDWKDGKKVPHKHIRLRAGKDKPRMIPQRLEDRTNEVLDGTNFMVFQPVERITYQPEDLKNGERSFKPSEWRIRFTTDGSGMKCAFLVDYNAKTGKGTGECHFFGGIPNFEGDARG